MNRRLRILATFLLLCGVLFSAEVSAEEQTDSALTQISYAENELPSVPSAAADSCGDNLHWLLSDDGVLTVQGTGAMTDYSASSPAPWYGSRASITTIRIDEGVTHVGSYAFDGCTSLREVSVADSVVSIGENAFSTGKAVVLLTASSCVTYYDEPKVAEKNYVRFQELNVQGEPAGTQYHALYSAFRLSDGTAAADAAVGSAYCVYYLDSYADIFCALPLTTVYENRGADNRKVAYNGSTKELGILGTDYRIVNQYSDLTGAENWGPTSAGTDQVKLYQSTGGITLNEDGSAGYVTGAFKQLTGLDGKIAYMDIAVTDASMDGNPDRVTVRQYAFGQVVFGTRKNCQNKTQETFYIRAADTYGGSTGTTLSVVSNQYDDANGRSRGYPFTSTFRWTGLPRAEIEKNAYVLYYLDEINREIDILAVVDSDPSDGIYSVKGYIRSFDTAADTVTMTDGTAYSIGHNTLLRSPLKTHAALSGGQNAAVNSELIAPHLNHYSTLLIVDNKVVRIDAAAPTQDYIIIDSFVSFDADGMTANVWSTATNSFEQVKLAEFNGWTLGGFDYHLYYQSQMNGDGSYTLPLNLHTLYQIVYQNDVGCNVTVPTPRGTDMTFTVNPYGYILGTKGTNSQLGDPYYVATSEKDYWLILDHQGNVVSYNGKLNPVTVVHGDIYKHGSNDYVIVVEDINLSIGGLNNFRGGASSNDYMMFNTSVAGESCSGYIPGSGNACTVLMTNVYNGFMRQVTIDPNMIPEDWDGRYETLGLENGKIYEVEEGTVLHHTRTFPLRQSIWKPASRMEGETAVWNPAALYDVRKAVASNILSALYPDMTSSEEMLFALMDKVTVYAQTKDADLLLTKNESKINEVLSEQGLISDIYYQFDNAGNATAWIVGSRPQAEKSAQFMMYNDTVASNFSTSLEDGYWRCSVMMTDVLTGALTWVNVDPSLIPAGWDGVGMPHIGLENGVIYRTDYQILDDITSYTFADVADFYNNTSIYNAISMMVAPGENVTNIKRYAAEFIVAEQYPDWMGVTSELANTIYNRVKLFAQAEDSTKTLTTNTTQINAILSQTDRGYTVYCVYQDNINANAIAWLVPDQTLLPSTNVCGDNLTWTLDNGTLTISGTGAMYHYGDGEAPWYAVRDSIQNVVFGEDVTVVGEFAFSGCTSLTSVWFPAKLTRVAQGAFKDCSSLTAFALPDTVTDLGPSALSGCTMLENVKLSEKQPAINSYTFENCTALTSLTVPESVVKVQQNAISNCPNLTIYANANSAVQVYAASNKIPFVSLDSYIYKNAFETMSAGQFTSVDKSIKVVSKQGKAEIVSRDGNQMLYLEHKDYADISGKMDLYMDFLAGGVSTWGVGSRYTFEYSVCFEEMSSDMVWQIACSREIAESGTIFQYIGYFRGDGKIYAAVNDEPQAVGTFKAGQWMRVAAVIDTEKNEYSLYVDGVCLAKDYPYNAKDASATESECIRTAFQSFAGNSTALMDDVIIYNGDYTGEVIKPDEPEISEYALDLDFEDDTVGETPDACDAIKPTPKDFSITVENLDGDKCLLLDHTVSDATNDSFCDLLSGGTYDKWGLQGSWIFSYDVFFDEVGTAQAPSGWHVGMLRMRGETSTVYQHAGYIVGNKLYPYTTQEEPIAEIPVGEWVNLAVEYDMTNKTIRVFVNGVQAGETFPWNVADTTAAQAEVARFGWSKLPGGVAYVDNVKAYNGTFAAEDTPDFRYGDVNGDAVINGKDLTLIRRFISGGFSLGNFSEEAADVNLDGTINGKDLTLIRRYISGGFDVTLGK